MRPKYGGNGQGPLETLEELFYVSSPLGIRVRIGMICRGCELEISRTLLTVDLRIMDMSEFDVILGMDWLTAYKVVIDCECRRATAHTQDGTRVTPRFRGSVDYPSTRGIPVDVRLPDATSENRVESPLYGELYPNKTPA